MSDLGKPEGSNANPVPDSNAMEDDTSSPHSVPPHVSLGDTSKKKSLQWDEDNLLSNAAEMERAGPRMKIDEPKTPFVGSETGSSTSGSAHQSPPESPHFIPGENLVGFQSLEQGIRRSGTNTPSDTHSSAGSAGRSVHISDEIATSGGSSPRSREEFAARRRAHYKNEARVRTEEWRRRVYEEEEEDDGDGIEKEASLENHHPGNATEDMDTQRPNGVAEGRTQPHGGDSMTNGHSEESGSG